jgi:hypothetical protein
MHPVAANNRRSTERLSCRPVKRAPTAASGAFAEMCSECLDGLFINVRKVHTARFHPPTAVNGRVDVASDRQRRVVGRCHRGGEAVNITSRNPRLHVMGLRQKFRNIPAFFLSRRQAAIGKATLCGVQHLRAMFPAQ